MMQELVSIIMPSYNTAKYIAKTIESVLKQTYTCWEIIIVDDCSTDETDEVVKPFLYDERVHYIKNDKNCGAAVSRNRALREAKGKWIAFLDSDDIWLENKLEKQISFMKDNDYAFSYTRYEEIDELDRPLNIRVSGPKRISSSAMRAYCWPGCLTVMYDREKVGLIQIKDIKKNNDYAMWLKICEKNVCWLLTENLAKYRKRKGSISRHGITTMIVWHYKLWYDVENKGAVASLWYTFLNLFFGFCKKRIYVNRV